MLPVLPVLPVPAWHLVNGVHSALGARHRGKSRPLRTAFQDAEGPGRVVDALLRGLPLRRCRMAFQPSSSPGPMMPCRAAQLILSAKLSRRPAARRQGRVHDPAKLYGAGRIERVEEVAVGKRPAGDFEELTDFKGGRRCHVGRRDRSSPAVGRRYVPSGSMRGLWSSAPAGRCRFSIDGRLKPNPAQTEVVRVSLRQLAR